MLFRSYDPCPPATTPAFRLSRRGLIIGVAGMAAAPVHARAGQSPPPDVGVYCEPTLAPAIAAAGRVFADSRKGAPVSVLTAPADLILLQVKQNPAEDLLVLPATSMDRAAELRYIDTASRWDGWRDRLVIATRADGHAPLVNSADLPTLLASGRIAATDPTPACTLDGVGLLDQLGLATLLAGRIEGVPDTRNAAFLVETGAAKFGLMYATDVAANPELAVAAVLDPAIAKPVMFAAALNVKPRSPNARAFIDFLRSADTSQLLAQHGLELV